MRPKSRRSNLGNSGFHDEEQEGHEGNGFSVSEIKSGQNLLLTHLHALHGLHGENLGLPEVKRGSGDGWDNRRLTGFAQIFSRLKTRLLYANEEAAKFAVPFRRGTEHGVG